MTALTRLLTVVAENAVLLLIVLPLVGALLVRLLGKWCPEAVHPTAVTNVWLTTFLSLLVVANFRHPADLSEPRPYQMVSALKWGGSMQPTSLLASDVQAGVVSGGFSITVGLDGFALPLVLLVVAVTLAAVRSEPDSGSNAVSRLSWLLAAEAFLVATLTAIDAVFLSFASSLAVIALTALIGGAGGSERREAARRFFLTQFSSAFLVGFALVGLSVVHWWMSIRNAGAPPLTFFLPTIVQRIPKLILASQAGHDVWERMSFVLSMLLLIGIILRTPLPPMHHWFYSTADQAERRVTALVLVGWMSSGVITLVRFVPPVFPRLMNDLSDRMALWSAAAACLLALSALSIPDCGRRLAAFGLCGSTLAFGVVWLGVSSATPAAVLLMVGMGGSAALGMLCLADPSSGENETEMEPELATESSKLTGRNRLVLAGILGTPFIASFGGLWLLLESAFQVSSSAANWFMATFVLLSWLSIDKAPRCRILGRRGVRSSLASLFIVLLFVGLSPHFFAARMLEPGPSDAAPAPEEVD